MPAIVTESPADVGRAGDDHGVAHAEVRIGGEPLIDGDRPELKCDEEHEHGSKLIA